MVGQAAGRGHDDVRMLLQAANLRLHTLPAIQDGDADILIIGEQAAQLVCDLDGQFARGREDQTLQIVAGGVDVLNHGDAEGKGLAGAGRRLGNHVLPCEQRGNGFLLHARGQADALFLQRLQDLFADAQLLKCFDCFHNELPFIPCVLTFRHADSSENAKTPQYNLSCI